MIRCVGRGGGRVEGREGGGGLGLVVRSARVGGGGLGLGVLTARTISLRRVGGVDVSCVELEVGVDEVLSFIGVGVDGVLSFIGGGGVDEVLSLIGVGVDGVLSLIGVGVDEVLSFIGIGVDDVPSFIGGDGVDEVISFIGVGVENVPSFIGVGVDEVPSLRGVGVDNSPSLIGVGVDVIPSSKVLELDNSLAELGVGLYGGLAELGIWVADGLSKLGVGVDDVSTVIGIGVDDSSRVLEVGLDVKHAGVGVKIKPELGVILPGVGVKLILPRVGTEPWGVRLGVELEVVIVEPKETEIHPASPMRVGVEADGIGIKFSRAEIKSAGVEGELSPIWVRAVKLTPLLGVEGDSKPPFIQEWDVLRRGGSGAGGDVGRGGAGRGGVLSDLASGGGLGRDQVSACSRLVWWLGGGGGGSSWSTADVRVGSGIGGGVGGGGDKQDTSDGRFVLGLSDTGSTGSSRETISILLQDEYSWSGSNGTILGTWWVPSRVLREDAERLRVRLISGLVTGSRAWENWVVTACAAAKSSPFLTGDKLISVYV